MPFERICPVKKAKSRAVPGEAYVRITPKMLYISSAAGDLLDADYITIELDTRARIVRFTPHKAAEPGTFKLSGVNETRNARRIETNNVLMSLVAAGLPRAAMGKRLPCSLGIDGALLIDYAYHPAPAISRERMAERGGDSA